MQRLYIIVRQALRAKLRVLVLCGCLTAVVVAVWTRNTAETPTADTSPFARTDRFSPAVERDSDGSPVPGSFGGNHAPPSPEPEPIVSAILDFFGLDKQPLPTPERLVNEPTPERLAEGVVASSTPLAAANTSSTPVAPDLQAVPTPTTRPFDDAPVSPVRLEPTAPAGTKQPSTPTITAPVSSATPLAALPTTLPATATAVPVAGQPRSPDEPKPSVTPPAEPLRPQPAGPTPTPSVLQPTPSVSQPATEVPLPTRVTATAVPTQATPTAVPTQATATAVPTQATPTAVPTQATPTAVPTQATPTAVPTQATPTVVPTAVPDPSPLPSLPPEVPSVSPTDDAPTPSDPPKGPKGPKGPKEN